MLGIVIRSTRIHEKFLFCRKNDTCISSFPGANMLWLLIGSLAIPSISASALHPHRPYSPFLPPGSAAVKQGLAAAIDRTDFVSTSNCGRFTLRRTFQRCCRLRRSLGNQKTLDAVAESRRLPVRGSAAATAVVEERAGIGQGSVMAALEALPESLESVDAGTNRGCRSERGQ